MPTYRSAVGGLLCLARDRPDLLFCVKELSAKMAQPTVTALQRLKKVMGYVKGTSSYAVVIAEPEAGQGKWKNTNESFWVLESASDSDWSSNKEHRKYKRWHPFDQRGYTCLVLQGRREL